MFFLPLVFLMAGCGESPANPDESFDTFYEGTAKEPESSGKIPNSLEEGFEFSGGNKDFQCTVTCLPNK